MPGSVGESPAAYQEEKGCDGDPARLEEEEELAAPRGAVADHVDDVLAKLVHS